MTLNKLLLDPAEFNKFLEAFPRNEEMSQARNVWVESNPALLDRLKGVEGIESSLEQLRRDIAAVTTCVSQLIGEVQEVRLDYLRHFQIPEYLIATHKERKLQTARWQLEAAR